MTFDKVNNVVSGARNVSFGVLNALASYKNFYYNPIRYNNNSVYKVESSGRYMELGDDKAQIINYVFDGYK
ncbi:hypothetical protein [Peptostreptococcus faecalis]|uniref:hypothetical protein n=1 Tax=Peptostreptococcus faecalis TaxID=2045015 RepID=UPI000C7AB9FA|nr:hypothetical protein [Peptostreptococcus faecalis]